MNLGDALYVMRQYDRAIEQYKNTLALDRSFPWPHSGLGSVYQVQGKFNESIAEYQQADSLGGSIPYTLVPLGWIYARAGRKADALRVLEELLRLAQHGNSVSYGIAFLYYELGEKDKAFEWFEKAYQDRDIWLESLGTDPLWDNLRLDPRCIALLKKMGLRK
jgi:tetratricopeptide (TPR) repeat protein